MGAKQKWTSQFLVLPMGITSRVEREGALVKNVCKLMDGDDGLAGWSWGLEDRNPVVVSTKYEYLCIACYPHSRAETAVHEQSSHGGQGGGTHEFISVGSLLTL